MCVLLATAPPFAAPRSLPTCPSISVHRSKTTTKDHSYASKDSERSEKSAAGTNTAESTYRHRRGHVMCVCLPTVPRGRCGRIGIATRRRRRDCCVGSTAAPGARTAAALQLACCLRYSETERETAEKFTRITYHAQEKPKKKEKTWKGTGGRSGDVEHVGLCVWRQRCG